MPPDILDLTSSMLRWHELLSFDTQKWVALPGLANGVFDQVLGKTRDGTDAAYNHGKDAYVHMPAKLVAAMAAAGEN